MSGGTFNQGTAAKILVGPSDPPTIELEGCKTGNFTFDRTTTDDDFYMEASDTSVGTKKISVDVSGKCKSGAPGLVLLLAAIDDDLGVPIWCAGSLEGTKGRSVKVRVSNFVMGFPDVNNKCTYSFKMSYAGDDTALAGGDIFA